LVHVNVNELLRRLPIVIVEDGVLHPNFPIVVRCMVAQTAGYVLPTPLLELCVSVIAIVRLWLFCINPYVRSRAN
jgi:hypothetical protein